MTSEARTLDIRGWIGDNWNMLDTGGRSLFCDLVVVSTGLPARFKRRETNGRRMESYQCKCHNVSST